MHKEYIKKLKAKIKKNSEDPIDILENSFKGKTVLVISGGPSALKWKEVYQMEKNKNLVIACVKQSINLVDDLCGLHFLNTAHLVKYKKNNSLSFMTHNSEYDVNFGKYDINFELLKKMISLPKYYLAKNKKFENFTLRNTGYYRPIGPGIMHEVVLYTLEHMGFKKIITVGWDISDDNGLSNKHFYEKNDLNQNIKNDPRKIQDNLIKKILKKLKIFNYLKKLKFYFIKYPFEYFKYLRGQRINNGGLFEGEAELVSNSLPEFKNWLINKDIELIIISDSKWTKTVDATS